MPGLGHKVAGGVMRAWTVPILWLSPRFHINNIVGGAVMTGLKEGPDALFRYGREAAKLAKSGKMDYRISGGSIMAPSYSKSAARYAPKVEQGTRLGRLWKAAHPKNLVEASRNLNQFL